MKELATYIKASWACLQILTSEEERCVKAITEVAKTKLANGKRPSGYRIWNWTVTNGLRCESGGLVMGDQEPAVRSKDPVVALSLFLSGNVPTRSLVIFRDFHIYLKQPNPMLMRLLKEAIMFGRKTNRHLIIVGCQFNIQPELEKEIHVLDMPLPSRDELNEVLESICKSTKKDLGNNRDGILSALSGLTANEASDAILFSIASNKTIDASIISRIKSDTVRSSGVAEIVDANVSIDDIGGLERLKKHLIDCAKSFTEKARKYGVRQPQSIVAVGNPGTGKSMSAMAIKTIFGLPLIRVEAGRLFGSLVGESEKNWRTVMALAKAIAPCILWIDEAEGLFAGMKSSGQCDGGTTGRLVKAILQDMQMNSDGVFFIFTSNDIDGFPDPLIDRCDVWAFDLPNPKERESIWSIHIRKDKRNPSDYDIGKLSGLTDGFSGRQIEQAWVKSVRVSFNKDLEKPVMEDIVGVLEEFVPTSVTMKSQIENRRARLKGRAQSAS